MSESDIGVKTATATIGAQNAVSVDQLNRLVRNPLNNNNLIKQINLTANVDMKIAHGLDRNYIGFFPTLPINGVNIWLSNLDNNQKDKVIILQSNATCIVDIIFF